MKPINLLKFKSTNPRQNLPESVRYKRTEILFQNAFLRKWIETKKELGVGGSQFELTNCGIADYIWVNSKKQIDAFEFKMTSWKTGLEQALRYKNYASRSYLVLPINIAERIILQEPSLKRMNVGIYGFDTQKKEIKLFLSPKRQKPLNANLYEKAICVLKRKRNFRQICESL